MSRRLLKEDKEQPRLQFNTKGGRGNTRLKEGAQGSDLREEGGGGSEGGLWLTTGVLEEDQWEDIPNKGEEADGSEAKEAHHTLRRNTGRPGRTNQSPLKNRRGFWLGRKSKLMGEASKKQNTKQKGVEPRSMETKTPGAIGLSGLEESNQELGQHETGTDHRATSEATSTGSNRTKSTLN